MLRSITSSRVPTRFGDAKPMPRRFWARWGFAWVIFGLLTLIVATFDHSTWSYHTAWCMLAFGMTGAPLINCLSRGFQIVIIDHLVMLVGAFLLYFVIGALFPVFGDAHAVARFMRYYAFSPHDALRVDAVNSIGLGTLMIVAAFSPRKWFAAVAETASRRVAGMRPTIVLSVFIIVGVASFAYTLVFDFGFQDGVVPGIVRTLSKLTTVAVFLCASYRGRYASSFHLMAICLALLIAAIGILMFNKTQVLVNLGALLAGTLVIRKSLIMAVGGLTAIVLIYVSLGPVVAYGRNTLGYEAAYPSDRWQLIVDGWGAREIDARADTSSWGRLSYMNAQAAALSFRDVGQGGSDFQLVPWLFVPRLLVASKPIITATPAEFHTKISGNAGSSTGQGVFVSGYYSGGWWGVLLAAAIAGCILAQTSEISSRIMKQRALFLLPFSLYGVYMAFRIDGSFLADYVGAFLFILYPALFFSFMVLCSRKIGGGRFKSRRAESR